jgi:hypothetical protein
MGLVEKRLARQLQETAVPQFEAELKSITGFEPKVEILWDTFIAYDEYPLTRLEGSLLPEILTALRSICQDDLGREALQANLERIRLENTDDENGVDIRFADKELYIKVQLAGGVYRMHSAEQMQRLLERAL